MNQRTQLILLVIAIFTLGGIVIGIVSYITSFQYMTISYDNPYKPTVVELHTAKEGENEHNMEIATKVQDVKSGERLRLKKGSYALITKGESYAENTKFISVGSEEETVNYELRLSSNALKSLLDEQRSVIQQTILQKYPEVSSLYSFKGEKILQQGDWYVAYLSYTGPDDTVRDTLRIIAHNEDGVWKVATPPQIAISRAEYPTIPVEILRYTNALLPAPKTAAERAQ